jgi:glycosyltransferase involved in cell wall biosynthesis
MSLVNKKYFLLSEIFYPDEISTGYVMTEIATKLSSKVPINVICGPAHFESKVYKAVKPLAKGVNVMRVHIPQFSKNTVSGRILRMIFLAFKMSFSLLKNVNKVDSVFLVTNPPLLLLFIGFLKKIRKFELIIIVHDVFPENVISAGILKETSFFYKILKWFFDYAYDCADKLIVVGQDMKELISKKTNKPIKVITNWADSEQIFPDSNLKLNYDFEDIVNAKIVIQFAGNIGRVQSLLDFVKVFFRANNPDIILLVIGEGAHKKELKEYVELKGILNIIILDALPREMQNTFLNSCDIGLVTLSKGMLGLGVPSKSYNILSAGKPILFLGDKSSEISGYIDNYGVGWTFDWDDDQNLIDFLNSLSETSNNTLEEMGVNARQLVERRFTKEYILENYCKELLNV